MCSAKDEDENEEENENERREEEENRLDIFRRELLKSKEPSGTKRCFNVHLTLYGCCGRPSDGRCLVVLCRHENISVYILLSTYSA